ncbi:hypothetical protein [Iningainema tapete]|uniref:Uncharacterized protein n=1 Tax=Iningainema tapete BLCC-T55 TaxID=2748662 RepID=A0A8J6XPL6_9CYAN|nr:hypothetical protein [Iningainema tapete]MBD2774996.1 hypothetical protein [Iningainema tapete BLCC-T55]
MSLRQNIFLLTENANPVVAHPGLAMRHINFNSVSSTSDWSYADSRNVIISGISHDDITTLIIKCDV